LKLEFEFELRSGDLDLFSPLLLFEDFLWDFLDFLLFLCRFLWRRSSSEELEVELDEESELELRDRLFLLFLRFLSFSLSLLSPTSGDGKSDFFMDSITVISFPLSASRSANEAPGIKSARIPNASFARSFFCSCARDNS